MAIVAEAVQHAHDRGVLHRDLKPGNVILQPTKEDPQEQEPPPGSCQLRGDTYIPRVVDFGLAKLLERGGPSETGTRQILGTPKYMAPEQAQARHDDIGPAADVYALGVILYEMLTGRAPYEGASDVEVLRLSIEGELTLPRHLRKDIPRDLEAICLKAMDRFPGRRYRTAIDLADDLRRFLDDKPTLARPLNWFGRAARWLRRNDQVVALATVTFIAVFFFALWVWSRYESRLNTNQENTRQEPTDHLTADQQRDYANNVRQAFLAWRAGDNKAASEALEAARRLARTAGEPTDFAMEYLAGLVAAPRLHIVCPAGAVTALAVSTDGSRLASGHADGTLALWNRATGDLLGSVKAHDSEVTHIAFALAGRRLMTVAQVRTGEETARGWAVSATGQITAAREPHRMLGQNVGCIAVSPDGNTVYAGTRSGELRQIHLPDRDTTARRTIQVTRSGAIRVITPTADGTAVLIATDGGKVFRCQSSLQGLKEEKVYGGQVNGLLESGGRESVVGLSSGLFLALGDGWFLPLRSQVHWLLPCSEGFAASGAAGRILLCGPRCGELATGDTGEVRAGAITRDGKTLFTAGDGGIIRSWELPADIPGRGVVASDPVTAIGVHPESRSFSVATEHSVILNFGAKNERPGPRERRFAALRIIKDARGEGSTIGVEFHDRAVVISELVGNQGTEEKARFALPDEAAPISADLSADGTRLAVGDDRGRVFVWNLADRATLAAINCGYHGAVERVLLSSDGMFVAAPAAGNQIGVWTPGDPNPRVAVAADDQAVFCFMPVDGRLVTAGRSGVIRVWNTTTGKPDLVLYGHVGRVSGLGVSPDGRTLVSGDVTGEVKLWDLRGGQELLGFRRHSGPVTLVEFAANGKLLVTGGTQIAVWDTPE